MQKHNKNTSLNVIETLIKPHFYMREEGREYAAICHDPNNYCLIHRKWFNVVCTRAAQYIVFLFVIAISTCAINISQKTAIPHG